jgi:hypothetical protein
MTRLKAPEYGPLFHLGKFSMPDAARRIVGNAPQALEAIERPHMEHQERKELSATESMCKENDAPKLTIHDIIAQLGTDEFNEHKGR